LRKAHARRKRENFNANSAGTPTSILNNKNLPAALRNVEKKSPGRYSFLEGRDGFFRHENR
jgi:hypothetical protein